ncbi:MAG: sugar phosphorylase [Desulfatitalea sp.]|nr:sugar phosphorylase [Desulfatitalea sp.]
METIRQLLDGLYGAQGGRALERLAAVLARFQRRRAGRGRPFSERDIVLITYGDTLQSAGNKPLDILHTFARTHLNDAVSAIHLLPFFPYSSDDGFSVIDYFQVDPAVGDWDAVMRCGNDFDVMVDFVLNHISARSPWVSEYLAGRPEFSELAIEVDPDVDLSAVVRPRALPLLTPFTKRSGESVHLWTTFSADQIDLNYKSIDVLCKMVEVLLYYVARGARMIRMDAVAYLWKDPGTPCIHLPQTHAVVRLLRAILDKVAPDVWLITETNVPHAENISYFGNGNDEAQMVYNFTLPPLLLHAFAAADTHALSDWAGGLQAPSSQTTFFNFTASHDGIGVRPLEGILPDAEIDRLVRLAIAGGGGVSYRNQADGTQRPYELNITYVDALGVAGSRGTADHAARFLASQAIQLCLPGVPGIYIHSLLGSRNWPSGVQHTGHARAINREKLDAAEVLAAFAAPDHFRTRIFFPYRRMLAVRRQQPAFHPNADYEVLHLHRQVFVIKRQADRQQRLFAITHIGGPPVVLNLRPHGGSGSMRDVLTGHGFDGAAVAVEAYQTLWLVTGA